ncbi:MAG TPA: alpha/beta fold hydrolase [Candidatus Binatia bacterium]
MTPRIQYVTTTDGVRIAFSAFGEGDGVPLVVLRPAMLSHVEAEWRLGRELYDAGAMQQLARNRRVVRLDLRRSGLSDRDVVDCSLDARMRDITTVVDRLGLERFAIDATSQVGLLAIAFSARYPDRVSHLVLTDSWVRGHGDWDSPRLKALVELMKIDWQLGTDAMMLMRFGWTKDATEAGMHFRACQRQEDFLAMVEAETGIDLTPLLPEISAPALVCSWVSSSHIIRADLARDLMAGLRDARLVSVRSSDDSIRAVEEFLGGTVHAPVAAPILEAAAGAFRTVVFTDVAGHTAMMQRLGDERGREVLRFYDGMTRDALRAHGGKDRGHPRCQDRGSGGRRPGARRRRRATAGCRQGFSVCRTGSAGTGRLQGVGPHVGVPLVAGVRRLA